MSRQLLLVTCLLTLAALSACQEHTAGLERSIARADETSALAALHTIATAEQTYSISNSGSSEPSSNWRRSLLPAHYPVINRSKTTSLRWMSRRTLTSATPTLTAVANL